MKRSGIRERGIKDDHRIPLRCIQATILVSLSSDFAIFNAGSLNGLEKYGKSQCKSIFQQFQAIHEANVEIPQDVTRVTVRAYDLVHGDGGTQTVVEFPH